MITATEIMYGLFQRKNESLNILKKFKLLFAKDLIQYASNVNIFKPIQFQTV